MSTMTGDKKHERLAGLQTGDKTDGQKGENEKERLKKAKVHWIQTLLLRKVSL